MGKNKKGFTLVELLVTIGLSGMVISVATAFFLSNFNSYKRMNNESELQFQGQYTMDFMTKKIMNSKELVWVKYSNTSVYNLDTIREAGKEYKVEKLSFKYGDTASENYVFQIVQESMRYGMGSKDIKPTVELGNYVKEMYISLQSDEKLRDAEIIKIKISLEKDNQKYEAYQTVFMRNN
jgi:prepilin-type N-terminal cleavage/methylation domain-containing protein